MGISSHQVRLMQLTSRKHTIGSELNRLANDKMDLTRDMSKASKEYQEALSAKVLKWSSNSGVTYHELSYNNLMKPSQMNGNTAYLLTDSSDRVVIDQNYLKYAEMISANGNAGGDWEGNRSKILSELVGVPEATINGVDASSARAQAALENLNNVKAQKPVAPRETKDLCCLLENVNSISSAGASFVDASNWADAYQHGKSINLGSDDPHNILSRVGSVLAEGLSKYFVTESSGFDPKQSPVYGAINEVVKFQESVIDKNETSSILTKDGDNYILNVQKFVDDVMVYLSAFTDGNDDTKVSYYNTESTDFKNYLEDKDDWDDDLAEAQAEYDAAINADNALLTADEERQIEFYDDLFSTIAEKGWTYNNSIDDNDYLNQVLQNGIYTITTVDRNKVENENSLTEDYYWQNTYNTDIATNYSNIFAVNDSDARMDAQIEYEHTKSIINAKETKIDTRMQNLKTEQDAVNAMIQSIESMIDENVDDKFDAFA